MEKINKRATEGNQRIKKYPEYDLCVNEVKELLKQATTDASGAYRAICTAYDAGIANGVRMAKKHYFEKIRKVARA